MSKTTGMEAGSLMYQYLESYSTYLTNTYLVFYIPELKHHTGQDREVSDYVMSFEQSKGLLSKLKELIDYLIPLYISEGKSQLVIAFGCTGGKHRSVTFAEKMYEHILSSHSKVRIAHRDISKDRYPAPKN